MTDVLAPAILVVGDAMVDRYIIGETTRISPEAPVPVIKAAREDMRPGGAANVAANVAALGQRCALLTICGDDAAGEDLGRMMAQHGVLFERVLDPGRHTTQKTRVISGVQQIARIDQDGSVGDAARSELARRLEARLDGVRAVIFSDYDKGALADLPTLLAIARKRGVPTTILPIAPHRCSTQWRLNI
jgi:D-beta-D-heptose 7-phosphate kinase/D-beta-D-heptose 1-phosphate adenosyltransferase